MACIVDILSVGNYVHENAAPNTTARRRSDHTAFVMTLLSRRNVDLVNKASLSTRTTRKSRIRPNRKRRETFTAVDHWNVEKLKLYRRADHARGHENL